MRLCWLAWYFVGILVVTSRQQPHVKTPEKHHPAQKQYLSASNFSTHCETPSEFSHTGPWNPSDELTASITRTFTILFPIRRLSSWRHRLNLTCGPHLPLPLLSNTTSFPPAALTANPRITIATAHPCTSPRPRKPTRLAIVPGTQAMTRRANATHTHSPRTGTVFLLLPISAPATILVPLSTFFPPMPQPPKRPPLSLPDTTIFIPSTGPRLSHKAQGSNTSST